MDRGTNLNILIVVFQAIIAVICVDLCRRWGWVEAYAPMTWKITQQWIPVNLFFCAMLFTGIASLEHNSVPMVTIFKNITNLIIATGDYFFFHETSACDGLVLSAFGIMVAGAIAAAWKDITITWIGIFWMMLNCLTTAGYVLYMKFATQKVQLSKFGMVYVNNVLCIALLFPVAFGLGQVQRFQETPAIHTYDYVGKNIFGGLVGFFLNLASLHCVATTGPTTYAIVGSVSKVPTAILGYLLFQTPMTWETWTFISVSMAGGFLYSYAQIQRKRSASAPSLSKHSSISTGGIATTSNGSNTSIRGASFGASPTSQKKSTVTSMIAKEILPTAPSIQVLEMEREDEPLNDAYRREDRTK